MAAGAAPGGVALEQLAFDAAAVGHPLVLGVLRHGAVAAAAAERVGVGGAVDAPTAAKHLDWRMEAVGPGARTGKGRERQGL